MATAQRLAAKRSTRWKGRYETLGLIQSWTGSRRQGPQGSIWRRYFLAIPAKRRRFSIESQVAQGLLTPSGIKGRRRFGPEAKIDDPRGYNHGNDAEGNEDRISRQARPLEPPHKRLIQIMQTPGVPVAVMEDVSDLEYAAGEKICDDHEPKADV